MAGQAQASPQDRVRADGEKVPGRPASVRSAPLRPAGDRAQAPAGGGPSGSSAALAGSTPATFTIALPAGLKLLSLNDRLHWRERNSRAQMIKEAACVMARASKVPRLERARITVEYQPPDRRHRDADNPVASAKAAVDGIVLAGVLEDDECPRYVAGIWCTIGGIFPGGRLVLHLTELVAISGLRGAA